MNDERLYVCEASLRYLKGLTRKRASRCARALIESEGDIIEAARQLKPRAVERPYHDYYYMGDKQVDDPDKDLPVLLHDPDRGSLEHAAKDGMFDGERFVAPFNDSNSYSEIEGRILGSTFYPVWEDWMVNSVTIQGTLMELTDRIRDRLRRKPPEVLVKYYLNATAELQEAKDHYFHGKYYDGNQSILEARKWLVAGQNVKKKRASDGE